MIHNVIIYTCPRCGSDQLVKNGHDYKGAQKFRCNSYRRYGTLRHEAHTPPVHHFLQQALTERVSLRGIARIFGLSHTTVNRWLDQTLAPYGNG